MGNVQEDEKSVEGGEGWMVGGSDGRYYFGMITKTGWALGKWVGWKVGRMGVEWSWWWREIHNGKWEELKEAASSLASLFSLSACCCPSLSLRRWHELSHPGDAL